MIAETTPTSPRLTSLRREVETGNSEALTQFWQEISAAGAPLVEPLADDETHVLVTFVWRGDDTTQNVVLFDGPAGWKYPSRNQLEQLVETDLWFKTYRVRADMRAHYFFSVNDSLAHPEDGDWGARYAAFQSDPLNPHTWRIPGDDEDSESEESISSLLELAQAPTQMWASPRPEIAHGQVGAHRFTSAILGNERRVWVYTPPGYTPDAEPYNLLVLFDGWSYIYSIPTPTIIDNLLSEGRIPPLVAVMVDSLDQPTRARELGCYSPFVDFLTKELLPWTHQHYHVTDDPAKTIVAGSSRGGLAAAYVAVQAPGVFGAVLSQSGAFWWNWQAEDDSQAEWLTRHIALRPRLPVRWYVEVGLLERATTVDQVVVNRHLRDVLDATGYALTYAEFNGGHTYACWRGSLAAGLLALASERRGERTSD